MGMGTEQLVYTEPHHSATAALRNGGRAVGLAATGRVQGISILEVLNHDVPERQAQLLIEVAVVDSPVPAHRDCVTAHHALCCRWVEGVDQQLHGITLVGKSLLKLCILLG